MTLVWKYRPTVYEILKIDSESVYFVHFKIIRIDWAIAPRNMIEVVEFVQAQIVLCTSILLRKVADEVIIVD